MIDGIFYRGLDDVSPTLISNDKFRVKLLFPANRIVSGYVKPILLNKTPASNKRLSKNVSS